MNRFFFLLMIVVAVLMESGLVEARAIDRTIAKVNDDILTESDLATVIAELRGEHRTTGIDAFAEATSVTVGSMLDRQLLLQEAKRLQIKPSEEELHRQVEDMVREVKDNFASETEFYHALAQERLSLNQFKDQLLKQTRDDFMVYHVVDSRFSVSDADVDKFKETEAAGEPIKLRLRRLGIAVTKKVNSAEACQKARAMVGRTITDGVSFEDGVRKYSEVPGAAQDGGDMGYMALDDLSADVRNAVNGLKTGQASAPVVAGGYANIFYVEGRRGAKVAVREQKFVEARRELLASLRRRAVLQVFDQRLVPLLPPEYCAGMKGELGSRDVNPRQEPMAAGNVGQSIAATPVSSPAPGTRQVLFAPQQDSEGKQGAAQEQGGQSQPRYTPQPQYGQPTGYGAPRPTPTPQPRRGWFGRSR